MKKLPKKIFVVWENAGTADEFLEVTTDIEVIAVMGAERVVGIYEFVEKKTAVNKTELV